MGEKMIPNSINSKIPSYVHGEIVFTTPLVVYSGLFNSDNEEENGIGKIYTHKGDGTYQAGKNGIIAGISINPKTYVDGEPFNEKQGEFLRRGEVGLIIEANKDIKVGDKLYYKTDGTITAISTNATLIPNCVVARNNPLFNEQTNTATIVASILL